MSDAPLSGALAGATFSFQTDAADLQAYARRHLAGLLGADVVAPAVASRLSWHDGQPPQRRPLPPGDAASAERVDRDTYVTESSLYWFRVDDLRDLHARFTWDGERLAADGDFYFRLGNTALSDRVRRLWQRAALRHRRFPTLLAYLVYYPCWWWLEQVQDLHPIHAAGVATDAGVILLAGASGVGKSTLAVALATTPGARLLSDSFVVHHGVEVRPVREPILLDEWSRRWLGDRADILQPLNWPYVLRRQGYQLAPQRLAEGGRAAVLLFPRRAPQAYVRRIAPALAHQRLSAADLMINDLRRYWAYAAVLEQLVPSGLVARREAQIAELVASVPCYDVGLTANLSCDEALASIRRVLDNPQLRVVAARP